MDRILAEESVSQYRTVLAGHTSCDWYDQQGEPGPDHYRVIARLIYPTQCSKCHSGVLFSRFDPLDKIILLS